MSEGRLVLTRQNKQGVYMLREGEPPIYVKIAEIRGDKAKVVFQAPQDYLIVREELLIEELSSREIDEIEEGKPVTRGTLNKFCSIRR